MRIRILRVPFFFLILLDHSKLKRKAPMGAERPVWVTYAIPFWSWELSAPRPFFHLSSACPAEWVSVLTRLHCIGQKVNTTSHARSRPSKLAQGRGPTDCDEDIKDRVKGAESP